MDLKYHFEKNKLDIIFLLSASNLILFNYWIGVGIFSSEIRYYFYHKPSLEVFLGISIFIFLFLILFLFFNLIRKYKMALCEKIYIFLIFFLTINILRISSNTLAVDSFFQNKVLIFMLLLIAFFYCKYVDLVSKIIKVFFIIVSPFVLVIFFNIFIVLFIYDWNQNKHLIKLKDYKNKENKIIFLIFDELDYRVLKKSTEYFNFNKILNKSTVYNNAFPGGEATLTNIPMILSGTQLDNNSKNFRFLINDIEYENNGKKKISNTKNLFSILDEHQYKIGVAGSYHRYCNIFYRYINQCIDAKNDEQMTIKNLGFKKYFIYFLTSIMPGISKIKILENHQVKNFYHSDLLKLRIENIENFRKQIPELINNNDFIYLHMPLPHAPWIYYNNSYNITHYNQSKEDGYYDNMKLTDLFLKEIIMHLEKKNFFNNSTIILLSDHGWREGDTNFKGSNLKKIEDRGGDVMLAIKDKDQVTRVDSNKKIYNYDALNLIIERFNKLN
jgi:hypothetical protein